jgi:hypothetical protein
VLDGAGHCCACHCHDHVHLEPDQLRREVSQPIVFALRITVLNDEVLALDIAKLAQPLLECLHTWSGLRGGRTKTKPTYPVHLPRRLRLGCECYTEDTEDDEGYDGPQ